jgi:FkbM family methyltransferase
MKIALDIGSHDGRDSIELLKQGYRVYAFEPMRELYHHFSPIEREYSQFTFLPMGIDIETGLCEFNNNNKLGTISSLHELNIDKSNEWWSGQEIETDITKNTIFCISLFDFCNIANIDKIDYLHCDAQGNDFNVLKSLKSKMGIVQEGVIEAAGTSSGLYHSNNNKDDIKIFLEKNGFEITHEVSLKEDNCEYDLFFRKQKNN